MKKTKKDEKMKKAVSTGKERRCMKVVMYIYLPKVSEGYRSLRSFAVTMGMGRLKICDQFNRASNNKMIAFDSLGHALSEITKEFKRRASKILPTDKKRGDFCK